MGAVFSIGKRGKGKLEARIKQWEEKSGRWRAGTINLLRIMHNIIENYFIKKECINLKVSV